MSTSLQSLVVVLTISALAPVVTALLPGPKFAPVVIMLLGGILVGPEGLDWAHESDLATLSDLGLGFLFLLAGYEIQFEMFRKRPGRLALQGWTVSIVLSLTVVTVLGLLNVINDTLVVAIALTTTALGTLLPILRESGILDTRLGAYVFSAGAVGELLPVIAMAIFLSTQGTVWGFVSLVVLGAATWLITRVINYGRKRGWDRRLNLPEHSTGQITLKWTLVILVLLLFLAEDLGVDSVMGAFLAGMVLRHWSPGDVERLEMKLDAVGYGVFIPIFFVSSGMGLDIQSIIESPIVMLAFFAAMFTVRGLPSLWVYRHDLNRSERWQMVLFGSTALPLLVALAQIGEESGTLQSNSAAAMVGAGVLSVTLFPLAGVVLFKRGRESTAVVTPSA